MQWTKEDAAKFKEIMEKYAENMMGTVGYHRLVLLLKEGYLEITIQKNPPGHRQKEVITG